MAGTTDAAPDDLLTCERCHGFYAVQVPEDGGEPRVRCNACGHIREVAITPVPKEQAGKWTVIGPDGKVMTFGSWENLVESRRPPVLTEGPSSSGAESAGKSASAPPDEKRPSASALLDITPTLALPKLTLAEADSDPHLLAAKTLGAERLAKSLAKGKGPEWAPVKTDKKEPAGPEKAPESLDEMDASLVDDDEPAPLSLRDAIPDDVDATRPWRRVSADDEPAPLSLRDAIPDDVDATRPWRRVSADDEPAPLSLRDAFQIQDESAPEVVSLRDVTVIPSPDDSAVDSTPAPPARGALKTLPPTKQGNAAPPPTITVEEKAESVPGDKLTAKKNGTSTKADTKTSDAASPKADAKKSDATKADAKKSDDASAKTDAKKDDAKKTDSKTATAAKSTAASTKKNGDASKDERKPVASARAAVAEEEPKRGWVLPSLAIIGVTVVIWRMMAGSSEQPPDPQPSVVTTETPATKETAAPPDPTVEPTNVATSAPATTATESTTTTAPPATATPTTPTTAAATTATTATPAGKKAVTATAGTDTATAAATAEKKPAVAETGMSMSDMLDRAGSARRSGDYKTARDLYDRVLRQNPGNVEANGGLGDVARAQGDLAAAKSSYERALAASPTYGPAQLGLADTEWDLGNRAGAQRRYAQIVERLGDRAPERARQRGVVTE